MPEPVIGGAEMITRINNYPEEKKLPYLGQHIAWSLDCTEILAHAWTLEGLLEEMVRLGRDDFYPDYLPVGFDMYGDPIEVRPEDRPALAERVHKMLINVNGEAKNGS